MPRKKSPRAVHVHAWKAAMGHAYRCDCGEIKARRGSMPQAVKPSRPWISVNPGQGIEGKIGGEPSRRDGAYPPVVLPLSYDGFGINQSDKYAARLLTLNVPPVHGLTPQQNDAREKEVAALIVRAVNEHAGLVVALRHVRGLSKDVGRYRDNPEDAVEDCASIYEISGDALRAAGEEV